MPEGGVAFSITAEHPTTIPGSYRIPHRWYGMHRWQYFQQLTPKLQRLSSLDFVKRYKGRIGRRDAAEIRPDDIVEDMRTQGVDGAFQGMNL